MENKNTLKHLEKVVDELKTTIQSMQESSTEIDPESVSKQDKLEEEIKEVSSLPIGTIVTSGREGKETHVLVLGKNKGLLLLDDSAEIVNTNYEESLRQGATISYSLPKYVGICLSDEKVVGQDHDKDGLDYNKGTDSDDEYDDGTDDEYSDEDEDDEYSGGGINMDDPDDYQW